MFARAPGAGSLHWLATCYSAGAYLGGGRSYQLRVPTNGCGPFAVPFRAFCGLQTNISSCYHDTMAKNLTVRLDDDLASDTEALARAEGKSLNETVKHALAEAVQRRREDPEFKVRVRRIIEEDRELLERLAK